VGQSSLARRNSTVTSSRTNGTVTSRIVGEDGAIQTFTWGTLRGGSGGKGRSQSPLISLAYEVGRVGWEGADGCLGLTSNKRTEQAAQPDTAAFAQPHGDQGAQDNTASTIPTAEGDGAPEKKRKRFKSWCKRLIRRIFYSSEKGIKGGNGGDGPPNVPMRNLRSGMLVIPTYTSFLIATPTRCSSIA
jgi:hypothetical protein